MLKITLVDRHLAGALSPELSRVAEAIQIQISEHFAPIWGIDARLGVVHLPPDRAHALPPSDGIVYVSPFHKEGKLPAPMAFHFENHAGVPCGFVFPEIAEGGRTNWSIALSHEILEMLVDPDLNLFVGGPHPTNKKGTVLRPYEICDPVQASSYLVHDVAVADFVTPQYFTRAPRSPGGRQATHYLDSQKQLLKPFGLLPGGYFSYFDLDNPGWQEHRLSADGSKVEHAEKWRLARERSGDAPRAFRRERYAYAFANDDPDDGDATGTKRKWPTRGDGGINGTSRLFPT